MITTQQHNTLEAIRDYFSTHDRSPTLEEIGAVIGVSSRGAVHRLVQALIDKGYVYRDSSAGRPVLRLPEHKKHATLPLMGRIAAGQPIEAIAGEETLDLSEFLLGPRRYALRVVGDSMSGVGILSGDTVVVEHADTAHNGEIIVALIDNEEATLKRLNRLQDGHIELIAENPAIPPMIYHPSRVRIQGIVVGQLRSYR